MNKQTCLELIKLFKSHRLLWDPLNTHFYHKELKEHAWKDISYKINLPVKEIKKKITNLRGVLRKERFRCRQYSKTDGAPYKSRWFAFEHLSFLEDIRSNQAKDTKNEPSTSINAAKTEVETDSNAENEEENMDKHNSDSEIPQAVATVWMQDEDQSPIETLTNAARKRKRFTKIIRKSKILKNKEHFYKSDNTYDTFGKLVASELRKYDNHTLAHVKKAIMDIIFQADTGNLPEAKIFNSEY